MSGRSSTGAGGWATAGSSPLCPSGTRAPTNGQDRGLQAFQGLLHPVLAGVDVPPLEVRDGTEFRGCGDDMGDGLVRRVPCRRGVCGGVGRRVVVGSGREADRGAADAHHGLGPYLEEPVGDLQVGGREVLHGRPSAAAVGVPGQFVEERLDAPVQGVLLPGHTCRDPVQDGRGHVDRSALGAGGVAIKRLPNRAALLGALPRSWRGRWRRRRGATSGLPAGPVRSGPSR